MMVTQRYLLFQVHHLIRQKLLLKCVFQTIKMLQILKSPNIFSIYLPQS